MNKNLNKFFNKKYNYAIIGASKNEEKYGFKILKILIDNKFNAIPINPKETKIYNQKTYSNINEALKKNEINVINFVTPPAITNQILDEINKTNKFNIKNQDDEKIKVWFQPGSWDEESLKICIKANVEYIKDFCLMKTILSKNN